MIITLLTGKTSKLKDKIKKELDLDIKVLRSSRLKKMSLKIDGKTQIPSLSIPTLCTNSQAFNFIKDHLDWINDKLEQSIKPQKFDDGITISIFANEVVIKHCPELRSGVIIDDKYLKVSGDKCFLHRRVKDYIKKLAKEHFTKHSHLKAKILDCKLNTVVIKDTKSRWGSCSSYNNINYNWRVALAPDYVIDYLISHEVAHLKHQDHSKDFWNCVKGLCPEYLKGKNWLKTQGKILNIYE